MFKNIIKRWFNDWQDEPRPSRLAHQHHMGVFATISPISNGFLVYWQQEHIGYPICTYCKTADEISAVIVTHQAKQKLGTPYVNQASDVKGKY